jgi:hypothetical protein
MADFISFGHSLKNKKQEHQKESPSLRDVGGNNFVINA